MREFALTIYYLLSAITAQGEPTIVGTKIKTGKSSSTCRIYLDSIPDCTATLTDDGYFRTAFHCAVFPSRSMTVKCSFPGGVFESEVKGKFIPKRKDYRGAATDSAALETKLSPLTLKGLTPAVPIYKDDVEKFFDKSDKMSLKPEFECWSESYGPQDDTKNYLKKNHPAYMAFVYPLQMIEQVLAYRVVFEVNENIDPPPSLFTARGLETWAKKYSLEFLSIPGDSGSPLYCRKRNDALSLIYLIGTLSGGASKVLGYSETLNPGIRKVQLGTNWTKLYPIHELVKKTR
jgi:hypothetical protein